MEIELYDDSGDAVVHQTAPDDAERIDFPSVESDVVISSYTLDGVMHVLTEPLTVRAGHSPRLKLWS